jgi:imidazole glycerol phosphate synthase glutamine amidotransferase subunit
VTLAVAIVDYGTGNIASLDQAFGAINATAFLASAPAQLQQADAVVLPGVGHFGPASLALAASGLAPELITQIQAGMPCLGICLGFQLLTLASEEAPGQPGLGLLSLHTVRIAPANPRRHKVPHLGWNNLKACSGQPPLLDGIASQDQLFYFANAYAVAPAAPCTAPQALYSHDQTWLGVVQQGPIHGVQFHPEKSRGQGLQLLRNFLRAAAC